MGGFVRIQSCDANTTGPFYVKAVASNGMIFKPKLGILQNGSIRYQREFSDFAFLAETVRYFDEFEIEWFVTQDFNALDPVLEQFVEWQSAGTSSNELMVTYKDPIQNPMSANGEPIPFAGHVDVTEPHHTILTNSCKYAQDLNDELGIVDGIYSDMKPSGMNTPMVFSHNGEGPLQYWGGSNPLIQQCRGVEAFLEEKDANCGEWSQYFEDMLRIHGIGGSKILTLEWNRTLIGTTTDINGNVVDVKLGVLPNSQNLLNEIQAYFGENPLDQSKFIFEKIGPFYRSFFLVKNWDFRSGELFSLESYFGSITNPITTGSGNKIWLREDTGIAGQGNTDPKSYFRNHAIVEYNDMTNPSSPVSYLYDPSYGSNKTSSQLIHEQNAIEAYGVKFDYVHVVDGMITKTKIIWKDFDDPYSTQEMDY